MSSKRAFPLWLVAGCFVILALGLSPAPVQAAGPSPNAFGIPTPDNPNPSADITATRATRPSGGWMDQTRSEVLGRNGVVATSEPLAAQAGLQIIKDGGNAIDAAVATMAMLALVEPNSCGLGAEMFAIIYDANTKQLYQISSNGPSPQNYTRETFAANGFNIEPDENGEYDGPPSSGIFAAMVPGSVDGWDKMLKRFGTMTFNEVLAPAEKYAKEGFPVHEILARSFRSGRTSLCGRLDPPRLPVDEDTANVYCGGPYGDVPGLYEVFQNPDMGHAFEVLRRDGRDAFYEPDGEIAQAIVAKANSLGVIVPGGGDFWTLDDLGNYQARWEDPLSTTYHGYKIWETPPPSQAWAALEMLNILEVCAEEKPFDLGALGRPNSLFTHIEVEAKKLAYSDLHAYNADPDFEPIYKQIKQKFNHKPWVKNTLCDKLSLTEARPAEVTGNMDGGTIYGASADRWGNMVSFVYSVYTSWGSKVTIPGYGFQLSSRGAMFTFDPNHPNTILGGKRPFITIIAAFITDLDDKPLMAFGNMGGGTQPQAHAQHVVNMIDLGYNVQATGDAARFDHSQGSDRLSLDYYLYQAVHEDLEAMGHNTRSSFGLGGGYQGIFFHEDETLSAPVYPDDSKPVNGTYRAGSELRKDGCAVGW